MRVWYLLVVLLLVPSTLAATCSYPTNTCDTAHFARVTAANNAVYGYYEGLGSSLAQTNGYAAALFYFHNQDGQANQLFQSALSSSNFEPLDAVYLTWTAKSYASRMDVALKTQADSKPIPASVAPADDFLREVALYLRMSNVGQLESRLRTAGIQGWAEFEYQPEELAKIVVGLQALYAAGDDELIRKLAEMNLDLLFTKFAAQSDGGVWVGPRSGDSIANGAYKPRESSWYGWSHILFGGLEKIVVTEPSLIVSGYCAHSVTRNVVGSLRVLKDNTGLHYFSTFIDPDTYAMGASMDVAGKSLVPSEGYVTKAYVQIGGDADAFIELNTRTSNEATNIDQSTQERVAMMNERIIIGDLGGNTCRESHALFGKGFTFASAGNVVAFENGGVHGILHFASNPNIANISLRYPNKAAVMPQDIVSNGKVAYPMGSGTHFALEMIPESVVQSCGVKLQCIADKASAQSQLVAQSGRVEYRTSITGTAVVHTLTPDSTASVSTADFAPKKIYDSSQTQLLSLNGQRWTLQRGGARVLLDFSGTDVDSLKYPTTPTSTDANYACADSQSGSSELVISNLGFVAATFKNYFGTTDYVIDCAQANVALPNNKLTAIAASSCVIQSDNMRSVAVIYQGTLEDVTNPPIKQALAEVGNYFPFNADLGMTLNSDLCTKAAEDTANNDNFIECGALNTVSNSLGLRGYDPLYVWVNGKHQALIVSDKRNPFSGSSWINGVGDWLQSVFGTPLVAGATNVADFKAAYFTKNGVKQVSAFVGHNGAGVLNATNFEGSIEGLANEGDVYKAGGKTQLILFTDTSPLGKNSKWSKLTRSLRVQNLGGMVRNFAAVCGTSAVPYIPECETPNSIVGKCEVGDRTQDRLCNAQCLIDDSACERCVDADNDGFFAAGCPDQQKFDCDDTRANVNPDQTTDVCGDGIDNDCDNIVDNGCSASTGGSTVTHSCSNFVSGCGDVCVVSDADGDGYLSVADGGKDCDDTNAAIIPGSVIGQVQLRACVDIDAHFKINAQELWIEQIGGTPIGQPGPPLSASNRPADCRDNAQQRQVYIDNVAWNPTPYIGTVSQKYTGVQTPPPSSMFMIRAIKTSGDGAVIAQGVDSTNTGTVRVSDSGLGASIQSFRIEYVCPS